MTSPEFRSTDQMLDLVVRNAATRAKDRRQRRRRVASVAAVIVIVGGMAAVAVALVNRRHHQDGVRAGPVQLGPPTTLTRPPLTETEGWSPIARAPLSGRSAALTAWTGKEMLVWRGRASTSDACEIKDGIAHCGDSARTDGAAYDPATDRWHAMPRSPLPPDKGSEPTYGSVWTGREMIVWGGPGPSAAAFDPESDSWRTIPAGPLGERRDFSTVWTGREMVIWGGRDRRSADPIDDEGFHKDGATYDPVADQWRMMPAAPQAMAQPASVTWDGTEMVVLSVPKATRGSPIVPMAFNPSTRSWRELPPAPVSEVTVGPVWTGTEIVVLGLQPTPGSEPNFGLPTLAATYSPTNESWSLLPNPPLDSVSLIADASAIWTGREVIMIGSPVGTIDVPLDGVALDLEARTWRILPRSGLSARGGMATAWTGKELLLWGGGAYTGEGAIPRSDGARYRPGPGR